MVTRSLQEWINAFHDGTVVAESTGSFVPCALTTDAAFFQRETDQVEWFRRMELIEVQEVALRFLLQPEQTALRSLGSTASKDESSMQEAFPAADHQEESRTPDAPLPPEVAEEASSEEEEDTVQDLEAELPASALPLDEAEDPQAFVAWLREITSECAPHPMSSPEFASWAVAERYRARLSRSTVVKALLVLRRSDVPSSETTVSDLAMSWAQLESQVMRHNVRAAIHWANRHGGSLPDELAFVFGLAGMRRAVRAFEPARGWKFLTFATWWIRQAVQRARIDYGTALRIPVHWNDKLAIVKRATGGYSPLAAQELSNAQILAEVANLSDRIWSADELERVRHLDRRQRLSDVHDPTDPVLAIDYLFDESRWMPTEVAPDESERGSLSLQADTLVEAIERALANVKPRKKAGRSRVVIYGRLGLEGQGRRPTLEQIGQRYRVTRERIRQVEAKGFAAIRKALGIVTEPVDE